MIFKINGERNSGTNFLEQLIFKNFKNVFVQHIENNICYFWKHGVPNSIIKQKDELVIDIFIFRELNKWLVSMYKNPYHLIKFKNFTNFLTNKQMSNEILLKNEINMPLNYDDNGKDIFEIRYYKYNKILEYYNKNNNVILVNLDFLKDNNNCEIFLNKINEMYNIVNNIKDWEFINKHSKLDKNIKESTYDININNYNAIINYKKNINIENQINNLTFIIKTENNILSYNNIMTEIVNIPKNIDYLKYLTVYTFYDKKRLGDKNDGGYVIADNVGDYDCYISAGVANEESFSRDFIKKYNMTKYNSYAFDGTIKDYPWKYTKNITFIKKNVSSQLTENTANFSFLMSKYNNIFLKMDIEGHEYEWLDSLFEEQLNKFKQIVIEFHGIYDNTWNTILEKKIRCFEKLSKSHYIIHIHGNNHSERNNKGIPSVVEITYLRKDNFLFPPPLNKLKLPCHLDEANCSSKKDYSLNFIPFVNV